MDTTGRDLISGIVDPPRAGDYSSKNDSPDRVQPLKDRDHQQQNRRRRQQKQFSKDDPHVDLKA